MEQVFKELYLDKSNELVQLEIKCKILEKEIKILKEEIEELKTPIEEEN
ncbi:hypothetical protein ACQV2X_05600 [Facklamia sp. P12945]